MPARKPVQRKILFPVVEGRFTREEIRLAVEKVAAERRAAGKKGLKGAKAMSEGKTTQRRILFPVVGDKRLRDDIRRAVEKVASQRRAAEKAGSGRRKTP